MTKQLSEAKIKQLIGLIERGKIMLENIKDNDYREAVREQTGG